MRGVIVLTTVVMALAPGAAAVAAPASHRNASVARALTRAALPLPPPRAPVATPVPPASGLLSFTLRGPVRIGHRAYTMAGARVRLSGTISRYAAGQLVTVHVFRGRRLVRQYALHVVPSGSGRFGRFGIALPGNRPGYISVTVGHPATPRQVALSARPRRYVSISPRMGFGSRGSSVFVLQHRLAALGYATSLSGVYDGGTGLAVLAYRKVNHMARVQTPSRTIVSRLLRGAGTFRARYPHHGRHIEADLGRQVLAEFSGGRVLRIYSTSSGKPSTPTILGSFRFYSKSPGYNSEGMLDSNYFIRGYAIHGYFDVPTYAASHGCLRIPISDARAVYDWVHIGNRIDVY